MPARGKKKSRLAPTAATLNVTFMAHTAPVQRHRDVNCPRAKRTARLPCSLDTREAKHSYRLDCFRLIESNRDGRRDINSIAPLTLEKEYGRCDNAINDQRICSR